MDLRPGYSDRELAVVIYDALERGLADSNVTVSKSGDKISLSCGDREWMLAVFYKVGDCLADYSMPTPEELAQPTGAEELYAKSKPVPQR